MMMECNELVLNPETMKQVLELLASIRHEQELMEDRGRNRILRPGYKCLFFGPPGTGKTMTATLLAKKVNMDLYRIDLSAVVSKYIGETEKNLKRIFEKAEQTDCILFFDEADALFGKRTNIRDAHDRYTNKEISYLFQLLEDYSGLVILASSFKPDIDKVLLRRFRTIINFPMPDAQEREQIWRQSFSTKASISEDIDLKTIAEKYKLTGGQIMNAVNYASLMAISRGSNVIGLNDLSRGIKREMQKEGKTM